MNSDIDPPLQIALLALVTAMEVKGVDVEGVCNSAVSSLLGSLCDDDMVGAAVEAILEAKDTMMNYERQMRRVVQY